MAVKETASFQAASERLNLSQSSVTRRVQKLEEVLGTALFERTTRHVRPTLAAKRLQLRAEAMLQDAQETTLAMRDESEAYAYQKSQTVTLATVPTIVGALVMPAIRAFKANGHAARIRIMDMAANEVAEAVAHGDADLGICSVPMLEPAIHFEHLFTEPIVLVIPHNHKLARQDGIIWQDLANEALILPARGTGNRLLIDEALARNQNSLRWTYEVGRSSTALEFVAGGIGLALLPRTAVASPYSGLVVCKPVSEPGISRSIGMISRIGQTDTPAVSVFKQTLTDQLSA